MAAGDGAAAAAIIRPFTDRHGNHPQLWMMLAESCRMAGDMAGLEQAADRVMAIEPRAIRAYGWKGDARLAADDRRGAASWYGEGVALGSKYDPLPDVLAAEIARQRTALAALEAGFAKDLEDGLAARGISEAVVTDRFAESLALLNGTKTIQLQRPKAYYLPGLAQRAFFEREEFAWVPAVEAATEAIRAELLAAMAEDSALFSPYLQSDPERPRRDFHGMTDNLSWSSLHLIENGVASPANQARFPRTLAAIEQAPLCRIGVRAPTIMFSRLAAHARIPPHHGMINSRLICHLPLIVPGAGALRCGNHQRSWAEGELMIFDDSMEHEAWNDADADRVVLIFDIWRPELTPAERNAIVALFEVIDAGP